MVCALYGRLSASFFLTFNASSDCDDSRSREQESCSITINKQSLRDSLAVSCGHSRREINNNVKINKAAYWHFNFLWLHFFIHAVQQWKCTCAQTDTKQKIDDQQFVYKSDGCDCMPITSFYYHRSSIYFLFPFIVCGAQK